MADFAPLFPVVTLAWSIHSDAGPPLEGVRASDFCPESKRDRAEKERQVQGARFLEKERVHLMQRDKPRAYEAALSLRLKPDMYGKPAPPAGLRAEPPSGSG